VPNSTIGSAITFIHSTKIWQPILNSFRFGNTSYVGLVALPECYKDTLAGGWGPEKVKSLILPQFTRTVSEISVTYAAAH